MKTSKLYSSILTLLALFFFTATVSAQYDDLYDDDSAGIEFENSGEEYAEDYDGDDYEYYNVDEEDGHYYSSRVRRFARTGSSLGYYSPIYTGAAFYGAYRPLGNTAFNSGFIINRRSNAFGNSINPYFNPYTRSVFGAPTAIYGNGFGGVSSAAYYCPPVGGTFAPSATRATSNRASSSRNSGSVINSTATRTGRTTTTRTGRDFRSNPTNTSVRTERTSTRVNRPRTTRSSSRSYNTSRSNNRSIRSPRTSTSRSSNSIRTSSSRSSGSVRSSSSRGSRG